MKIPLTETEKQIVWMFAVHRFQSMQHLEGNTLEMAFADAVVLFNGSRLRLEDGYIQTSRLVLTGNPPNPYFVRVLNGEVHVELVPPPVVDDA